MESIENISNDELLEIYKKIVEMIEFLNKEVETDE